MVRRLGRVLRADGSPAPGALVGVVEGDAPTPEIGIRADSGGWFHVALPEGRFVVEAYAGGVKGRAEVDGASDHEIVLRLAEEGTEAP